MRLHNVIWSLVIFLLYDYDNDDDDDDSDGDGNNSRYTGESADENVDKLLYSSHTHDADPGEYLTIWIRNTKQCYYTAFSSHTNRSHVHNRSSNLDPSYTSFIYIYDHPASFVIAIGNVFPEVVLDVK
jgi:hypothetical protein